MSKIEQPTARQAPHGAAQSVTAQATTAQSATDQDTSAVVDIGELTLTMAEKMDLDVKFVHNVIDTVLDVLSTREFWEGVIKATAADMQGCASHSDYPSEGSNTYSTYSTTDVDDLLDTPEEAYQYGYNLGYRVGYHDGLAGKRKNAKRAAMKSHRYADFDEYDDYE